MRKLRLRRVKEFVPGPDITNSCDLNLGLSDAASQSFATEHTNPALAKVSSEDMLKLPGKL